MVPENREGEERGEMHVDGAEHTYMQILGQEGSSCSCSRTCLSISNPPYNPNWGSTIFVD